jgi:hypothetical protein
MRKLSSFAMDKKEAAGNNFMSFPVTSFLFRIEYNYRHYSGPGKFTI